MQENGDVPFGERGFLEQLFAYISDIYGWGGDPLVIHLNKTGGLIGIVCRGAMLEKDFQAKQETKMSPLNSCSVFLLTCR
jgi:hypothetical protein